MTRRGLRNPTGLLDGHFDIEVARLARAVLRRSFKRGNDREVAALAARVSVSSELQRSRDRKYTPFQVAPWIHEAARELAAVRLGIEFQRMIFEAILEELVLLRMSTCRTGQPRRRMRKRADG